MFKRVGRAIAVWWSVASAHEFGFRIRWEKGRFGCGRRCGNRCVGGKSGFDQKDHVEQLHEQKHRQAVKAVSHGGDVIIAEVTVNCNAMRKCD